MHKIYSQFEAEVQWECHLTAKNSKVQNFATGFALCVQIIYIFTNDTNYDYELCLMCEQFRGVMNMGEQMSNKSLTVYQ